MSRLVKPNGCRGCDGDNWQHFIPNTKRLTPPQTGFSVDEGAGTLGVLIVGEALGQNEDADGLPFRPAAQAGSLLERAFKRCGYSRSQFRITNVCRCRPPHDILAGASYEFSVIQHCRPNLLRTLEEMKPRCILALGGTAFRELTGFEGKKQGISYTRGYVVPCVIQGWTHVPVIGTFHPSFIRQGKPEMFGVFCHDIKQAVSIAQHGAPVFPERSYITSPSQREAEDFAKLVEDNPDSLLAYDIETFMTPDLDEEEVEGTTTGTVESIQFSICMNSGIFMPWLDPYIDIAKFVLARRNKKIAFNCWTFDDPVLASNGVLVEGQAHDIMWAWHALQPDLPRNLQFVASFYGFPAPWKHLAGTNPALYGIQDVDALQYICKGDEVMLGSLHG